MAAAVEQRLGYPVFGEPARFKVSGTVEKGESGFHAQLTLQDAGGTVLGTREVSTPESSCAALDPRVTLVLALMISPTGALGSAPVTAAPAAAPPMLPAPPAPGPLLTGDHEVRVHIEADDPRVQLVRFVDNRGTGGADERVATAGEPASRAGIAYVATTVLCDAPCDRPVKASARLFIGGEGILPSEEFSLEGLTAATLQVKTGSGGRRVGGLMAATFGLSILVGGIVLLAVGLIGSAYSSQPTLTVAGAILSGAGGTGLLAGLLLMRGTGTTVTIEPVY